MDVDILSSLLTLGQKSELSLLSLNRSLGRHPDLRHKRIHIVYEEVFTDGRCRHDGCLHRFCRWR